MKLNDTRLTATFPRKRIKAVLLATIGLLLLGLATLFVVIRKNPELLLFRGWDLPG